MRRTDLTTAALAALGLLAVGWTLPALAQNSEQPAAAEEGDEIVYQPPMRGAPAVTVGGATRSLELGPTFLVALAPGHTGLTMRAQPRLYWYLSRPEGHQVQFTLAKLDELGPMLTKVWPVPEAGVHAIDLQALGVELQVGQEYFWTIILQVDPDDRSRDIVARGTISRADPTALPPGLTPMAKDVAGVRKLAHAGLWYDAVDALSGIIAQHPDTRDLRLQRAALLDQVNLWQVAAYDRERAKPN
jgi:hypothetical protein